jgi:hypothetical protein
MLTKGILEPRIRQIQRYVEKCEAFWKGEKGRGISRKVICLKGTHISGEENEERNSLSTDKSFLSKRFRCFHSVAKSLL